MKNHRIHSPKAYIHWFWNFCWLWLHTYNFQGGASYTTNRRNKNHIRIVKSKRETCACGDVLCNGIAQFLKTSKWSKCCYKRPKSFGNKFSHKRRRSEIIHNQFMLWRKKVSNKKTKWIIWRSVTACIMNIHTINMIKTQFRSNVKRYRWLEEVIIGASDSFYFIKH